MMMTMRLLSLTALLLAGCAGPPGSQEDSEGDVGVSGSSLVTTNALTTNALTTNALTMNALTMNALTMNALSPSNFAAIVDPSASGGRARQLLEYTVSCAFDETQSFGFAWTDVANVVHNETYWGSLGLAKTWPTKPISTSDQEWVSACLIARVNWYGVSVPLSARGDTGGLRVTDSVELDSYDWEEGAFWGNLFAVSPRAYSCSYGPNNGHSRWALRDCAAGHFIAQGILADCGLIDRLGSCNIYCNPLTSGGMYHPRCWDSTASDANHTSAVITIFLQ